MQNGKRNALIWLRNDLRLLDHYAFHHAAKKCEGVVAYYALDPNHFTETPWGFKKTGPFRSQFLIETLHQLSSDLAKKNISLIVETQAPEKGISHWVEQLHITDLYYQEEWTREEEVTAQAVRNELSPTLKIHNYCDQFLFHPEDLPMEIENLPEVFTVFRKACEKQSKVRPSFPEISTFPKENCLPQEFKIPAIKDLGFSPIAQPPHTAFPFKGGSRAGQQRMEHYFWETEKLSFYKQTRNGLLGLDYSSKFSAWLANGSLSARQIYWEIKEYEAQIQKNQSTYWLIFELIWRDYFKFISLKHQDRIFQLGGILQKDYHWKNNPKTIQAWIDGETREPFVNANMIELQKTGWMSNRGRQNVASYFAKDLLLDWRIGAAYFESQLMDYDVHSNYGNWMYVAGVGNDPRDRKFNIRMQAERYDEGGKFQRLWNQQTLFE